LLLNHTKRCFFHAITEQRSATAPNSGFFPQITDSVSDCAADYRSAARKIQLVTEKSRRPLTNDKVFGESEYVVGGGGLQRSNACSYLWTKTGIALVQKLREQRVLAGKRSVITADDMVRRN